MADHREPLTTETRAERPPPLATIPTEPPMEGLPRESSMEAMLPEVPLVSLRRLPVPIRQRHFDSFGVPTVVWVPLSRESDFPPPLDTPALRGRDHPLPSQKTPSSNDPLPGSALNLSANTKSTRDECPVVTARDQGKSKPARRLWTTSMVAATDGGTTEPLYS